MAYMAWPPGGGRLCHRGASTEASPIGNCPLDAPADPSHGNRDFLEFFRWRERPHRLEPVRSSIRGVARRTTGAMASFCTAASDKLVLVFQHADGHAQLA